VAEAVDLIRKQRISFAAVIETTSFASTSRMRDNVKSDPKRVLLGGITFKRDVWSG
jgi:hypothetical protein